MVTELNTDIIERTIPHLILTCASNFRERYQTMSFHEWPFMTNHVSEQEEVAPSVYVKKRGEYTHISNTGFEHILALREGVPLCDVLKTELSDSAKAIKMLIDGAPGMGKTTSVQSICMKWSKDKLLQHFMLVVLISLREMKVECIKDLFQFGAFDDQDLLQRLVEYVTKTRGRDILFIFDGFDELSPEERRKDSLCLKIIKGEKLAKCSVIVTSRPHASEYLVERKELISCHVEILGFNKQHIYRYINSRIPDPSSAKTLISELEERPNILSLCSIPLNCAVVISSYKQVNSSFPVTQTELFQNFILGVLKRHADCVLKNEALIKELRCCQVDSELPQFLEQCLNALGKLAYSGICNNRLIFTYKEIKSSFPENHECHDSSDTIETFCLGLLTTACSSLEAARKYNFLHSHIQEYLAARYCSKLENLSLWHIYHIQFEQFALFYAGLTKLDGSVLENILCFEILNIRNLLPYCHLVFESQKFCLFQILFDNLRDKTILDFTQCYKQLTGMDYVVIAHFLCYTKHSWKELRFDNCYLSDQSLHIFVQVDKEYHSGITTFEKLSLNNNQPSFATKLYCFPWLSNTKYLIMHCNVHTCTSQCKSLNFDSLTHIANLDIKLSTADETKHQIYVDFSKIILQSVDLDDISDLNLECTKTLALVEANRRLVESTFLFFQHSQPVFESITLNNCDISDNIWTFDYICSIAALSSLTELRLIHMKITSQVATSLFEILTNNNCLKLLDLSGNPIGINDIGNTCSLELKKMLSANTTLKDIKLLQTEIDDNTISNISSGMRFNSTLEFLDLNENNQISVQTAFCLIQSIHWSGLQSLRILGVEIVNDIFHQWQFKTKRSPHMVDIFCALCASIHHCGNTCQNIVGTLLMSVTTLDLKSLNMSSRLAKALFCSVEQNTHLKSLNISHNNLADNGEVYYDALKSMLLNNVSLRTLKMECCNLMDSICAHVSVGLSHNSSLKELYLRGNKINNNGAYKIFESLSKNECLEILDLSSNALQFWDADLHVSMIKMVLNNKTIKLLKLSRYPSTMKSVDGRVIEVSIKPVPQHNSDHNKLFQTFLSNISGFHITDNICSLHQEHSSFHMKCNCYRNRIHTDLCLKFICSVDVHNLHSVDLSGTNLSSSAAILIFQSLLREDCFIKDLDLSNNYTVTFEPKQVSKAIKAALEGGKCSLQVLCLSKCAITDAMCTVIAAGLGNNRTLTKLDLSKNCISTTGVIALFQSLKSALSILAILNLEDNNHIDASEDMKDTTQSLFSANATLKDVNLLNTVSDGLIESLAKGLMINNHTKLNILHCDITLLSASALLCLLEALSKRTQVLIQGSEHCFSFEHLMDSQWQVNFKDKLCFTKLYCTLHKFYDFKLSTSILATVQVLDLKNIGINTDLAVSLFHSLRHNEWLRELDLSQSRPNIELLSSDRSLNRALKQMLLKNKSLVYLNLYNIVVEDIAHGLVDGLRENETLQALHIDINSLNYQLVAELLHSLNSSRLLHVKIESVGIFHARIFTESDSEMHKLWCEVRHTFRAFLQVLKSGNIHQYLKNIKVQHNHELNAVQAGNRWCMHLEEGGSMLLKFFMALSKAVRDHQSSGEIVLDMWRSIKKMQFHGYDTSNSFEEFIQSLVSCPYQSIEHIEVRSDVLSTTKIGDSLMTLLTDYGTLSILSIHTPISDDIAFKISEVLPSNLRKLDINIEFLSIKITAKIIQCIESSELQEVRMTPLLLFQQQQVAEHSWCMKVMKGTSLQYVHRLYNHIKNVDLCLKHGIFKTLELRNSYLVSFLDVLKSLEAHNYPFLEAVKVIISTEIEDEHHRICTTLNNVLSRQCHLKVLRVAWSSNSLIKKIICGLKNNKSLTVLQLECDQISEIDLIQLLRNISSLTEFHLSCSTVSPSNTITPEIKSAFKQFLTSNNNTLRALEFCIEINCEEIVADIKFCATTSALNILERLCISADSITEKSIASLVRSISSGSCCVLNIIEVKEFCTLKRLSDSNSWHLEVKLNGAYRCQYLDHLFQCLNSTTNLEIENPVVVLHCKQNVLLPLHAFGNQTLKRCFEFRNANSPINLTLYNYQNETVEVMNSAEIKETLSKVKLDTLTLHDNMPLVETVIIPCIADEELQLTALCLTSDIFDLNKTAILNLLTLLNKGRLTEVSFGCKFSTQAQLRLKKSNLFDIDCTNSVDFLQFFCILNEIHGHSVDPMICAILIHIRTLDFSNVFINSTMCIRLLRMVNNNNYLEELSLPGIREKEMNTSDISVAIGDVLTANKSLTSLKVVDYSYCHETIVDRLASGLSKNSNLKRLCVFPWMILLNNGVLLKSVLSHEHLTYMHSSGGCTHLRRDTKEWELNIGKAEYDDKLVIIFFCSLMKIYRNDQSMKERALSILQTVSVIEMHFHNLIFAGLDKEFMESICMNSTVKFVDMYECQMSDTLLQTIKAITICCASLEQLHLQLIGSNECASFDGVCDTLQTNVSLKDVTISLSSSAYYRDLSAIILEFNKSCELSCDIKIEHSEVNILRSKEDASWEFDLLLAGNKVCSNNTFGYLFDALQSVQKKQALNFSFHLSESIRSLDISMADVNTQLAILQSVIQKSTLKYLDLINSKLFVDLKVDAGIIHGLLLQPSQLEYINMSLCTIDNTICDYVAQGLRHNTSLKVLRLAGNNIQGEGGLKIFKALIGNSVLVTLDLSSNKELTHGENEKFAKAIQDMLQTENSSLKCLNLGFCNVTDEICNGIALGLCGNITLKKLYLQGSSFTHQSVIKMLKNCNNIEELNLWMNKQLTSIEGSDDLGNAFERLVKTSTSLKILELCGSVNDIVVRKIVSGMEFKKNLEILNVDQCHLSAKTVADLVTLCEYEGFKELFVIGTRCTHTYIHWDEAYHWTVENHGNTHNHIRLFFLLILSEHGQSHAMGQRAYRKLCSLSNLDISDCNISSSQFFSIRISLSILPKLVVLNLSRNKHLSDDHAETSIAVCSALNELLLQKRIKAVNISCTGIHPQSWRHLFTGLTNSTSSLEVLDISGNTLGQEGSDALIEMLSSFGGVVKLNISYCTIPDEFFNNELVRFLRPPEALKLNCDEHQLHELKLKFSDAVLKALCIDSYAWWHKQSNF